MEATQIYTIPEEIIHESSTQKLAEWGSLFNSWIWPDGVSGKPDGWAEMILWDKTWTGKECKSNYIKPIAEEIRNKIGEKACMKYHHMYNLGVIESVFETWWEQRNRKD